MNIGINSNGILAIDLSNLDPSCDLGNANADLLDQFGLWMMAEDAANDTFINAQYVVNSTSFDFSYAPLDTFTGQQAIGDWNQVWLVDAQMIAAHIENYSNTNYSLPDEIAQWPAKSGQDLIATLAPFADANSNGVYDPENGDYPYIKGDKAAYCIFNDNSGEHKVSKGVPIGVEVHLMLYQYDDVPSTVFLEYYIINRSSNNYSNFKVGAFLGGQLGNATDNFMGTMSDDNAVYMYKGTTVDSEYGEDLPLIYCKLLDQNLSSAIGFADQLDPVNGKPINQKDFVNYLNARWLDNSVLSLGDDGHNSGSPYPFLFDASKQWSEDEIGRTPGNRNVLAVSELGELPAGSYVKVEYALGVKLYDSTQNVHELVKTEVNALRAFTGISAQHSLNVKFYPNPCADLLHLEVGSAGFYKIQISDFQGRVLYTEKKYISRSTVCNISLPSGVYRMELNRNGRIFNDILNVQP